MHEPISLNGIAVQRRRIFCCILRLDTLFPNFNPNEIIYKYTRLTCPNRKKNKKKSKPYCKSLTACGQQRHWRMQSSQPKTLENSDYSGHNENHFWGTTY